MDHNTFPLCPHEWMRKLAWFPFFPLTCLFLPLKTSPSKSFLVLDWIDFILFRNCSLPSFRMTYLFSLLETTPSKSFLLLILTLFLHLPSFCNVVLIGYFFLDLLIFLYFLLVSIYNDNSLGPQVSMQDLSHLAHVLGVKIK